MVISIFIKLLPPLPIKSILVLNGVKEEKYHGSCMSYYYMLQSAAHLKGNSEEHQCFSGYHIELHWVKTIIYCNKTFREWQHPQPAEISKFEHQLNVAISYSDQHHCRLHHATTFKAITWFPQFHLPGPSLSGKISKFHGTHKNWLSMASSH